MANAYFELKTLPDLSLNKYKMFDENGVEGVLKKHSEFLRLWNQKGLISKISIHLICEYDNRRPLGERLKIGMLIKGTPADLTHTTEIMCASSLSPYFSLTNTEFKGIGEQYKACVTLFKKDYFTAPSSQAQDSAYYNVTDWEPNEECRLLTMFKLMEAIGKPCLFRIDAHPADMAQKVRESLKIPMLAMRRLASMNSNTAGGLSVPRDENANSALRKYEKLIETIETNPHFMVNIYTFAENVADAKIIINAAGAEALTSGTYELRDMTDVFFKDRGFMDKDRIEYCSKESPPSMRYWPTLYTLEELAPFFRFPALYDGEHIELPKETAPKYSETGAYLGKDRNGYNVFFPLNLFSKHAFLAGVPGSGKTNSMLHLATMLKRTNIPFLILEPVKREYRALAKLEDMSNLIIFSPSAHTDFPLHINPFEFPQGLTLSEHIGRLVSVFEGSFPLEPPMPFILDTAIQRIYEAKGWMANTVNDGSMPYPTLSELYARIEAEIAMTDYSDEISGNLKSALQVRIGSLLRREMGDVFDVSESTIRPEKILSNSILVELEDMGTGPANFLTLMMCTLIRESLKIDRSKNDRPLKHVIFIEEAHNLIGPKAVETTGEDADPKLAATAFIVRMLAEVRALREGIIIADQLPTAMAPEVLKNTGLKIAHRITASDDREILGGTMSASELQLERVATFLPGEALVTYEGLLKPFEMSMHEWENGKEAKDSPSDEDLIRMVGERASFKNIQLRSLAIRYKKFINKFNVAIEDQADFERHMKNDPEDYEKYIAEIKAFKNGAKTFQDNNFGKLISKHISMFASVLKDYQAIFQEVKMYYDQNKKHMNENFGKQYMSMLAALQTQAERFAKEYDVLGL
jgi:hypothetical protein